MTTAPVALNCCKIAALLSCFVFQEKSEEKPTIPADLAVPYKEILEMARKIAEVEKQCRLPVDVDEYLASFPPNLMNAVYSWAQVFFFHVARVNFYRAPTLQQSPPQFRCMKGLSFAQ